eukprot:gnl/Trimastix_PCT/4524.p1 GENE.gnl/Trimastix_PCT/4524~~gnl/Trimastix_PCT/4524.p1  ORF type:complete len:465 (+),score=97.74 gnl/Trimastix_PCT/4524:123-1517(+)
MGKDDDLDSEVLARYRIIRKIGRGAYGVVYRAEDRESGTIVALKKSFDAFSCHTDAQRSYREVMFLVGMQHRNVIRLRRIMRAKNDLDLYLIFDFMDADLNLAIRSQILQDKHIKYLLYQLLRGLHYIHRGGLLHRDLKPGNLLITSDCALKLGDFGLARLVTEETNSITMTDYVSTRWYRAPELLVGAAQYSYGVDMWSVGCILAEMLGSTPLFPGDSTIDQLQKIADVLGTPKGDDLAFAQSSCAANIISRLAPARKKDMGRIFPRAPSLAVDLMHRVFKWNPADRISAAEAMRHPYLEGFFHECDLHVEPPSIHLEVNDNYRLTAVHYRDLIYNFLRRRARSNHDHILFAQAHLSPSPQSPVSPSQSPSQSAHHTPTHTHTHTRTPHAYVFTGTQKARPTHTHPHCITAGPRGTDTSPAGSRSPQALCVGNGRAGLGRDRHAFTHEGGGQGGEGGGVVLCV